MRNMSFMLTTRQFEDRSKTVTRRLGWDFLRAGDVVMGCEKCQGLRKGEKVRRLGAVRIVSVGCEPLDGITQEDVAREGFPEMSPEEFVTMFCEHNHCDPSVMVNRIEFEYVI